MDPFQDTRFLKPTKYDMNSEMAEIKKLCGWVDHSLAEQTHIIPPWRKAKTVGGAASDHSG